jgi:hypothetical protein
MKKLLLSIFLLLISSHAKAKVEIWLCNSKYGIDIFKIDTTEPLNTSQRINKDWKNIWTPGQESEVEDIIYDMNLEQIKIIYNNQKDKKEVIFDLVLRDLIIKFHDENKSNSKWSCELK